MLLKQALQLENYTVINPKTGEILNTVPVNTKLIKLLEEAKKHQNAIIKNNQKTNCTDSHAYSNIPARKLTAPKLPKKYSQKFLTNEMNKSEAYRILGAWQKRDTITTLLQKNNWTLNYKEAKTLIKKQLNWNLDIELYKNIMRTRKRPKLPVINTPQLPLAKTHSQYAKIKIVNNQIFLSMIVFNEWVHLVFEIPKKIVEMHSRIHKVSLPTIRLDSFKNKIVFVFSLFEHAPDPIVPSGGFNSVIAVDPGMKRVFAGARVFSDGSYSSILSPSVHTERHSKAIKKYDREISLLSRKNKARKALGVVNEGALREEEILRRKRRNARREETWSAVTDVIAFRDSGEVISLEKNRFATGGSSSDGRWANGLFRKALEHKCARVGVVFEEYSAFNASHVCPKCFSSIIPEVKSRLSVCSCGWSSDRDHSSAVVGGLRTLSKQKKLSGKKALRAVGKEKPTP